MRVHPISLALQYLKGKRSWNAAPYYGGSPFQNEASAIARLKQFTGQDFGRDAKAWDEWLRKNRAVIIGMSRRHERPAEADNPPTVNPLPGSTVKSARRS